MRRYTHFGGARFHRRDGVRNVHSARDVCVACVRSDHVKLRNKIAAIVNARHKRIFDIYLTFYKLFRFARVLRKLGLRPRYIASQSQFIRARTVCAYLDDLRRVERSAPEKSGLRKLARRIHFSAAVGRSYRNALYDPAVAPLNVHAVNVVEIDRARRRAQAASDN